MTFTPEQIKELSAPLSKSHVKAREQSGRTFSYIEAWWAIAEANRIFGFDSWNRETVELVQLGEPRQVNGKWRVGYRAKVRITVGSIVREGCGFGSGIDNDVDQAHESALKEAESDAMKRAMMTFGNPFGLALYDKTQANVVKDAPPAYNPDNPPPSVAATAPPSRANPNSRASLKRSTIYETLRDEMDACQTVDELLAWDDSRAADIRTLPADWKEALGDRFWACKAELEGKERVADAEAELEASFRATVGGPGSRSMAGSDREMARA